MKSLIYKILAIFGAIFTIFKLGKESGKTALKNEINKNTLKNARESKKRQLKRTNDSIDDVRSRMSKYVRE